MERNKKILYYILIGGFVILYLATAIISFVHAIEFFAIGNAQWMATALAGVFELGQMTVLSSLLLTDNKRTILPWILLIILTSVQVVGNVFSVFKFIQLAGSGYYVYLQKPLIDWWLAGVSQETIQVIISWIIGALLPIIALFMTSMVSNNIKLLSNKSESNINESHDTVINTQEQEVEKQDTQHVDRNEQTPLVESETIKKPAVAKAVTEVPVNANTNRYIRGTADTFDKY